MAFGAAMAASEFLGRLSSQPVRAGSSTPGGGSVTRRPLFFAEERIEQLRARIANDAQTQARWKKCLQQTDDIVAGLKRTRGGNAPAPLTLGLAWRITREERYAKRLRDTLLKSVEAGLKPGADADNHDPVWHSWLQTAAFVVNCTIGREALEGYLSPEDRQRVTDGLLNNGVLPILQDWVLPKQRIHALDSMGHNWWSVCVSGGGIGALALLGEDERAAMWLNRVETALAEFFDYQGMVLLNKTTTFDPAGGFYESVGYAGYALESYLTFRFARTNALPTPPSEIPVLNRMAEFFIHTLYPRSTGDLAVDFGDSGLKSNSQLTMRLLAILGYSPGLTRWYLQRNDPQSAAPLALLYLDDAAAEAPYALPASVAYPTMGWATMRDSWNNDATFLAVKCGFTWNHAHADAGSFVWYHAGRPLLIDSGRCEYSHPDYLDYYCQSRAHNVVLFNGAGQPAEDFHDRGVKFPGHVHDLVDNLGIKYIYADATGPMARYLTRNYRHWLWVDGVILVFDDLRAHEAGQFDWLLHYAGEAQADGSTIRLSNEQAKATVSMLYPPHPAVSEETGLAADTPHKKVKYLKLSTTQKTREQKFIVALVPQGEAGSPAPKVELLQEPNALGVRVTSGEQTTDAYLNLQADGRRMHANSINTISGWETDAYLLAVTRPGNAAATMENVNRYFLAGCSFLRRNGQSVLDSYSKITGVFQPGKNVEFAFHGQPHVDIALMAWQKTDSLQVNKELTPFHYDATERTVGFQRRAA